MINAVLGYTSNVLVLRRMLKGNPSNAKNVAIRRKTLYTSHCIASYYSYVSAYV